MSQIILQPSEMLRTLLRYEVEYRRETNLGVRVIRVLCYGKEPRISAWTEHYALNGTLLKEPMTLGLEEITLFVTDARNELNI